MNEDPAVNVVVFEVVRDGESQKLVGDGPVRAADCVRQVWLTVRQQSGARAEDVRQVYSEWEPSAEDKAFLDATFPPQTQVTYSFARPPDDGWEQALAEAARSIHEAMQKKAAEEMLSRPPGTRDDLLPVLRTYDPADAFAEVVVHRPVGANLAVFLAHVRPTPRGTQGIDYLMRKKLEESGGDAEDCFTAAWTNLARGLRVDAYDVEGERVFGLSRPGGLSSSALGLPDFYANATGWVGAKEFFVAIQNPDALLIAPMGSPATPKLQAAVEQSDYWGAVYLTPACYCWDEAGLRLLAARPGKAASDA
jgi:hypothetical protein